MIELFHADHSTCSQKVRICLAEKNLDYVDRQVSLGKGEHLKPDYLAINPNGVVPALRHDGAVIVESTVICEYLDEVFPAGPLSPPTPVGRAHMRAWLRFIDEVPSMAIRVPTFQNVILPIYQRMSKADFERMIDAMPVRKYFMQRMGQTGFSKTDYDGAIEQLERTLARMDKALAAAPWLCGDQFTIADICMVPTHQRMVDLNLDRLWDRLPRVADWFERIRARPSYAKAFYKGAYFTDHFPELLAQRRRATA